MTPFEQFAIGFDQRDRARLHELWDQVLDSHRWTESRMVDCAHAHGADWRGRRPGSWGDAGVWSFYATKTISTGEGGMLSSRHEELLDFARGFRNYGKPDHGVEGLSLRMSEFTAALGVV